MVEKANFAVKISLQQVKIEQLLLSQVFGTFSVCKRGHQREIG
jgi:hypothetical protein